jgi:predicted DNA-binding protein (MmcQ/YjbR family)
MRDRLLSFALGLPEAWEDHPWDDTVVKVRKKIFLFLGDERISVKLPMSADQALAVEGARPTGYGLGRAGWVSLPLGPGTPPFAVLCDWIEESYRTVAPKTLVRLLDDA